MDKDILNIEEIVMGRGLPDPPPEVPSEKPAEPSKPNKPTKPITIKPPPAKPITIKPPPAKPITIKPPPAKPNKPITIKPPPAKPNKPITIKPPPAKPITIKPPPASSVQSYQHENLQCFQCFITFCSAKAKERHMKKSHREEYKQQLQQGNTLFTCYVCDRTFLSSDELTQHQPTHSKEDKPFKCVHCKESFRIFSELTTHRRQVCPERQMICKDCNEIFRSAAVLRTHRLTQHPRPEGEAGEQPDDPTKTHRCSKCGQGFETEAELVVHQEKYSAGQQCNGSASSIKKRGRPPKPEDLAAAEKKGKRMKKEEGEATEEAETGSSTSELVAAPGEEKGKVGGAKRGRPPKAAAPADKKNPADDSQAPTKEKKPKAAPVPSRQHPCPECDLAFHGLVALRAHKKEKHTPRKAHACEECEESFARPQQLEAHKARVHTAGRFACPTCGKSFGRERTMKAHQKSHPEEKLENRSMKR